MFSSTKMTFCKALRRAHSIIALIMRVGEAISVAERAVGKVLHGKTHSAGSTHPNTPHETRSRIVPSSTPNLSTLQHSVSPTSKVAKRWIPPSPNLPTVRSNSLAKDSPTTTTTRVDFCEGGKGLVLRLVHLGGLQEWVPCLHQKGLRH